MGMLPRWDDECRRMEQPIETFRYSSEATDYLRCRLSESGDALAAALLEIDLLHRGEVSAQLPEDVDVSKLYKFRTDIFWGWPKEAGAEIAHRFLAFTRNFLRGREGGMLLSEAWVGTTPELEPPDIQHFQYASVKQIGRSALCRCLNLPSGDENRVRRFLHCINTGPIAMADLSRHPETLRAILAGEDISGQTFSVIASSTVHISVDVYDGRANLIWSRKTDEELRAKWQAGNKGLI